MSVAPLADVKARLSAYVDQCQTAGPVVITRNGKAAAVLVAPRDEDELERILLAHSPKLQAMMERAEKSHREGKTLSLAEFRKVLAARTASRQKGANGKKTKRK